MLRRHALLPFPLLDPVLAIFFCLLVIVLDLNRLNSWALARGIVLLAPGSDMVFAFRLSRKMLSREQEI
jgi:hypothetical protein